MYFIASSLSEWSPLRRTADEEKDNLARNAAQRLSSREQEEEPVEREWREDEGNGGSAFQAHRAAVAAALRTSGAVARNNTARRSQVSNPNTIAPPAPKLVNRSSTFLEPTMEVQGTSRAQSDLAEEKP